MDAEGGIGVNSRSLGWGVGFVRPPSAPRRWLTLKLVGTQSNRSAIGAQVRVVPVSGEQRLELHGGGSYNSQSDLRLHFSRGDATAVDRVIIRWPNGSEEVFTSLAVTGCTPFGNDRRCPFAVSLCRRRLTCRRTCSRAARRTAAR